MCGGKRSGQSTTPTVVTRDPKADADRAAAEAAHKANEETAGLRARKAQSGLLTRGAAGTQGNANLLTQGATGKKTLGA